MKKEDLKYGNVLESRYGEKILVCNSDEWINLKGMKIDKGEYLKDLTYKINDGHTIVKVYEDYTCQKVLWERKETPELTEDEKVILRNLSKEFKWIARDRNEMLYVYEKLPNKVLITWNNYHNRNQLPFPKLFNFITWEDEEPYFISDLLGEE